MKPRRRYAARVPMRPPDAEVAGQREMLALREVAHAVLNADRPEEAIQFALDRVAPVVGATLASVYLVEGASELMRLVAAHNWPDHLRPWLADVRVRVGFGPSGEAASERRVIEVPDVLGDPDLEDWQDVARELGFRALVALPMQVGSAVLGAVAFYFADWADFTAERRGMLRIAADLMAGAAEKSRLVDRVRRAEAAAVEALTELDRQYVAVARARRGGRAFIERAATALRPVIESLGDGVGADAARTMVDDLVLVADIEEGLVDTVVEAFDPRLPLRGALQTLGLDPSGPRVMVDEPAHDLPLVRGDREKLTLLLARLLARARRVEGDGAMRVAVGVVGTRVEYRLPGRAGEDPAWLVAEALAGLLDASIAAGVGGATGIVVSMAIDHQAAGERRIGERE